jgi:hypothetical protein
MLVASVREHFNAGIREPEKLASIFSTQQDFSYEKSLYHFRRILEKPGIRISCSALKRKVVLSYPVPPAVIGVLICEK